jgi:hypothetical protein
MSKSRRKFDSWLDEGVYESNTKNKDKRAVRKKRIYEKTFWLQFTDIEEKRDTNK